MTWDYLLRKGQENMSENIGEHREISDMNNQS